MAGLTMLSLLVLPGLGKSQLASVIAQEMATTYHEVLGQSITNIGDLNALLLAAADKDIIHIDEAHELDKQFQTALYLAIDKRTIFVNSKRCPEAIPIAEFSLLALHHGRIRPAGSASGQDETDAPV